MKALSLFLSRTIRFGRFRFSYILFMSYFVLCTIPIVILTNIFFVQARNNIEEAAQDFSKLYASQINNTFNMYMRVIDNTSTALFTDYDIIYYLGREESYSTIDKINTNMKVNLQLAHYSTQMPYLEGIMIISSS